MTERLTAFSDDDTFHEDDEFLIRIGRRRQIFGLSENDNAGPSPV